jgi:hypothetical protein
VQLLYDMGYTAPKFLRGQVDKAGRNLAAGTLETYSDVVDDLTIINNWRSCHAFPLNSFHVTLRARALKVDTRAITAQRIKRLSSIDAKLSRFPKMQLSRMHDIGGCRAILRNIMAVRQLVAAYKRSVKRNPNRAELVREYDYLTFPKEDGYRCVHLVFRYRSSAKKHRIYNGLRIEIQLRSQLQHTWATAVETVGTFIGHALKSSQGPDDWRRFFALMSTYIAMKEKAPLIVNTPQSFDELCKELRKYADQLNAVSHLTLYATSVDAAEKMEKNQHYFLLELDPSQRRIRITGYTFDELAKANTDYMNVEREILKGEQRDAVLVSVKSFAALKRAYPNYFLDTHRFIQLVNEVCTQAPTAKAATHES